MFILIMVIGLDVIVQFMMLQITLYKSYLWTSSWSTNHPHWPFTIRVGKLISIFFVGNRESNTNTARNKMTCFPIFQYFIDNQRVAGCADICNWLGFNLHAINSSTRIYAAQKVTDYESNFLKWFPIGSTSPVCSFFLRAWRYMLCLTVH